eukprot:13603493-Ditylum_brightwellii.AAC.1
MEQANIAQVVSQCLAKAMDTSLVPVEEAVNCVVLWISKCVCLPKRYKAGGHSHPCTICNSVCVWEEGYIHVGSWSIAGSSQEDLI